MRRGKLLGLKWEDKDFEGKCIYVRRSAWRVGKLGVVESDRDTAMSRRKIMLPNFVVDVLKMHQLRQREKKAALSGTWSELHITITDCLIT